MVGVADNWNKAFSWIDQTMFMNHRHFVIHVALYITRSRTVLWPRCTAQCRHYCMPTSPSSDAQFFWAGAGCVCFLVTTSQGLSCPLTPWDLRGGSPAEQAKRGLQNRRPRQKQGPKGRPFYTGVPPNSPTLGEPPLTTTTGPFITAQYEVAGGLSSHFRGGVVVDGAVR